MSIGLLFLLAALVLFLLGAFGVPSRVNWTDLGLACVVCAMIAGSAVLHG